jgi:hypothetical protein
VILDVARKEPPMITNNAADAIFNNDKEQIVVALPKSIPQANKTTDVKFNMYSNDLSKRLQAF